MHIILNGTLLELEGAPSVLDLLSDEGYGDKTVAVAINGDFLPKEKYDRTSLKDNDKVEIVAPMQGG